VAVGVDRDRDRRVAGSLADDLRVNACPQGVCGVGVPQVVKPNPTHTGKPDSPLEVVAEQRRVDRISAFGGAALPNDDALLVDGFAVDGDRYRKVIRGDSQSARVPARFLPWPKSSAVEHAGDLLGLDA